MTRLPFFVTACPHCTRKLELQINRLGRSTICPGCERGFAAQGVDSVSAALEDPVYFWVNFTDHPYADCPGDYSEEDGWGKMPR